VFCVRIVRECKCNHASEAAKKDRCVVFLPVLQFAFSESRYGSSFVTRGVAPSLAGRLLAVFFFSSKNQARVVSQVLWESAKGERLHE
jgi:hypothetical protein